MCPKDRCSHIQLNVYFFWQIKGHNCRTEEVVTTTVDRKNINRKVMFTPNSFLPKVLVASKVYCIIGNNYKYKHTQLNLHFIQVLSCVDIPTLKQSRTLQCCNLNIYLYVFQIQFSQKSIQCIYISSHD